MRVSTLTYFRYLRRLDSRPSQLRAWYCHDLLSTSTCELGVKWARSRLLSSIFFCGVVKERRQRASGAGFCPTTFGASARYSSGNRRLVYVSAIAVFHPCRLLCVALKSSRNLDLWRCSQIKHSTRVYGSMRPNGNQRHTEIPVSWYSQSVMWVSCDHYLDILRQTPLTESSPSLNSKPSFKES
jgi:hypothetical protein